MFELNLIKDKAKARQRRRVIFLSIVSILFLAALVSMFAGSLVYREQLNNDRLRASVKNLTDENNAMDADLKIKRPKTLTQRNRLIKACVESERVRNNRRYFTPALEDLYMRAPAGAEFWYTSVDLQPIRQAGAATAGSTGADLLGFRSLYAEGYVMIVGSDVLTQKSLENIGGSMRGMHELVGNPQFTSSPDQGVVAGAQGSVDEPRYIRFSVQALQQVFTGGTP